MDKDQKRKLIKKFTSTLKERRIIEKEMDKLIKQPDEADEINEMKLLKNEIDREFRIQKE